MQLTPIRVLVAVLVLATCAAACGQVTGLSNDYVYDLQEDGGAASAADAKADSTAAADGAMTDAAADSPVGVDAAVCSAAQAGNTELRLTQFNGSMGCKTCLADDCCTDVDSCLNVSECRKALSCRLNCTTLSGIDRHTCFQTCASNSGGNTTPMSYTSGVGACAASKCNAGSDCAFL
jgi:hypothetical protein